MNFCRTAEKLKLPIASPQTILTLRTAALTRLLLCHAAAARLAGGRSSGDRQLAGDDLVLSPRGRHDAESLDDIDPDLRAADRLARQKHFDLISLEESQHRIASGDNRRPSVSITFDDGYADNCQWALPLLLERKIPFTYFVSSQNVLEGMPFPHDVQCGVPFAPNTPDQIRELGRGRRRDRLPHPQPSQFGAGQRSGGAV